MLGKPPRRTKLMCGGGDIGFSLTPTLILDDDIRQSPLHLPQSGVQARRQ